MRPLAVDLHLASLNIFRHWRRSAFAVTAVASGITALLLGSGFIEWNFHFYRESIIHSQLGHIQIHRAGYSEEGSTDPYAFVIDLAPEELERLHRIPHVRSVSPRLAIQGLLSFDDATLPFIAEGIDAEREFAAERRLVMQEGGALTRNDRQAVILGAGLALNLGVTTGDRVVLLVNTPSGGINAAEFFVKGTFTTVSKAYDDIALRLPIREAERLARIQGAQTWIVLLEETDHTHETLTRLHEALPSQKYESVPWWELSDFYNKSAALFSKQVWFMKAVIGVLIVLLISNTMTMSVMSRTGEIGTAMALGAKRASLLRRFVLEGFFVALAGSVLGAVLGLGLAAFISWIGIPVPPPPGMSRGYVGEILVTPAMMVDAAALAVGTTLLASAYPAWKASRMVIIDALRHNRA